MGKNEFANQQPTQNLVGRGRRGIHNTTHTNRKQLRSQHPTTLPSLAILTELSFGTSMEGFFSPPSSPFFIKLTKKHGLPKSQHSAGQVPLAANVQPNKHIHKRKLHPGAEL